MPRDEGVLLGGERVLRVEEVDELPRQLQPAALRGVEQPHLHGVPCLEQRLLLPEHARLGVLHRVRVAAGLLVCLACHVPHARSTPGPVLLLRRRRGGRRVGRLRSAEAQVDPKLLVELAGEEAEAGAHPRGRLRHDRAPHLGRRLGLRLGVRPGRRRVGALALEREELGERLVEVVRERGEGGEEARAARKALRVVDHRLERLDQQALHLLPLHIVGHTHLLEEVAHRSQLLRARRTGQVNVLERVVGRRQDGLHHILACLRLRLGRSRIRLRHLEQVGHGALHLGRLILERAQVIAPVRSVARHRRLPHLLDIGSASGIGRRHGGSRWVKYSV